uniref:Glycoside hydrolase family protein 28 n=1 Tax=Callosobruchus maculatus TaxID=64391 RepID=E7CIQ8_CALMS|nr:glycoside hydrolase family protein 28 [Callosobruchus maculatus]
MLLLAIIQLLVISAVSAIYDVTRYGADRTGRVPCTDAIARAIKDAEIHGGGLIHFPSGRYLTGPIELKSNMVMDVGTGTIITFLDDPALYPPLDVTLPDGQRRSVPFTPLIRAWGQKNVGIRGNKVIFDGRGEIWWDRLPPPATRPIFVNFFDCHNVVLKGFTIKSSPMFNVNILHSSGIVIDGVRIRNPESYHGRGPNTDGINLVSVRKVHITGVDVATGDDCVVFNAWGYLKERVPTEDVLIENSYMSVGHGAISIGSVTAGGLRNITVRNCVIDGTTRGLDIKTNRQRGGTIENINYYNITMNRVRWEGIALIDLFNDNDPSWKPIGDQTPFIRNIRFDNIRGSCDRNPILVQGLPEAPIENIEISNTDIRSPQPIRLENSRNIVINGRRY